MAPFINEKLPGEPIIINTLTAEWRVDQHLQAGADDLIALLEDVNEPCYCITDVREMSMSIDDMIRSANSSARGASAMLHHPLIKELLLITNSKLIELSSKGLRTDIFGNVRIQVFMSMDDALTYAREQLDLAQNAA